MGIPELEVRIEKEQALGRPQILLIDDDRLILNALEKTLQYDHHTVHKASNGAKAFEMLQKYPIGIVICDLHLPDMDGIQILKEVIELKPECIRMIITGLNDLNKIAEAVNVGQISQFILKPWDDASLRQIVQIAVDKYLLVQENQKLNQLISSQQKALKASHEHLKEELKIGARIHEALLLGKIPKNIPGLKIDALTIPSEEIDGDFFDFYRPSNHILDVVLGDVMGKGIPAALVGNAVKTHLSRFAMPYQRTQIYDRHQSWQEDVLTPEEILSFVHEELVDQLMHLEFFASLFYGRFNLHQRTLIFVDCGSSKPIHYQDSLKQAALLKGEHFPLGLSYSKDYSAQTVLFGKGDIFIFYSDGVTEARSPQGDFFGVERLQNLIEKHVNLPNQEMIDKIKQEVSQFSEQKHFKDDFTIIVIKVDDILPHAISSSSTAKFSADLAQLKAVRQFVRKLCQEAQGNIQQITDQLQLALNEAFCNIVNHGYERKNNHHIIIQGEYQEDGILIEISDQGKFFNPTLIEEPDLSGNKETGFGLYIIRQLADQVHYIPKISETGWNHLRIFKSYVKQKKKMEIKHQLKNQILVITLEGESLDAREAPLFKQKVQELMAQLHARNIIFDLHQVQFIDSSGLGSFLSILKLLNAQGGKLKLCGMSSAIQTMFELVCMHKIFENYASVEDALKSFQF